MRIQWPNDPEPGLRIGICRRLCDESMTVCCLKIVTLVNQVFYKPVITRGPHITRKHSTFKKYLTKYVVLKIFKKKR